MSTPILHGWFKFHREALYDVVWSTSPSTIKVWLTCLAYAHHRPEPGRFYDGEEEVAIPRGAWLTSYPKVAHFAGVSRDVAIGALRLLKKLGRISLRSKPGHWILIQVPDLDTYKANMSQGKHESTTPILRRDHYLENREKENISKNISKGLEPLTGSSTRKENNLSLFEEDEVRTKDRRLDAASYDPAKNGDTGFSRSSSPKGSKDSSNPSSWYAREAQEKREETQKALGLAEDYRLDGEKQNRRLCVLTFAISFATEALEAARQGTLDLTPYEALLAEVQKQRMAAKEAMGIDPSDSRFDNLEIYLWGSHDWTRALDEAEAGVDPAKIEARRLAEENRENEIRGYAEAAKAKAAEARKAKAEGQSYSEVYWLFNEATKLAWKFEELAKGLGWKDEAFDMCMNRLTWEAERPSLLDGHDMWSQIDRTGPGKAAPTPPTLPNETDGQNKGEATLKAGDVPVAEGGK